MNKKRFLSFLIAVLSCYLVLAQHPGSSGGNPLYWGIVGGIGALICYLLYLGTGFVIGLIKINLTKKRTKGKFQESPNIENSKELNLSNDNHYTMEKDAKRSSVTSNTVENPKLIEREKLCKLCGKPLPKDAIYCCYCGADQREKVSKIMKTLKRVKGTSLSNVFRCFLRFIFVLALCAAIGGIPAFICNQIGGYDVVPLCIIAPTAAFIIYLLIAFAYNLKKKTKNITVLVLSFIVISLWGISIYGSLEDKERKNIEYLEMEESHRVNRTFLNCSFGSSYSNVLKTLHNKDIAYRINSDTIIIDSINYGNYTLNSLKFMFYKDKMYKVVLHFKTREKEDPDQPWTYNNLADMLNKKYERDYSEKQYDNVVRFSDDHTKVRLWHADWGMGEYGVSLVYYDKDSGYQEHQEKGF